MLISLKQPAIYLLFQADTLDETLLKSLQCGSFYITSFNCDDDILDIVKTASELLVSAVMHNDDIQVRPLFFVLERDERGVTGG